MPWLSKKWCMCFMASHEAIPETYVEIRGNGVSFMARWQLAVLVFDAILSCSVLPFRRKLLQHPLSLKMFLPSDEEHGCEATKGQRNKRNTEAPSMTSKSQIYIPNTPKRILLRTFAIESFMHDKIHSSFIKAHSAVVSTQDFRS